MLRKKKKGGREKEYRRKEWEGAGKELVLSKTDLLTQWFSNFSKCQNHLDGLLKQRFESPNPTVFHLHVQDGNSNLQFYQIPRLC